MLLNPVSIPAEPTPLDLLREANQGLRRVVLDNGMVVLIKPDRSAPVVAIQIWIGTGAIHEGDYLGGGMAHYLEHMVFKGTATRGPADITRAIDDAGGRINAYTAHDRTVFYCDLPAKNWRVGLDVLTDAVMNASLPEDEWEREKDVILREFAMGYDSPPRVHSKLLWETAFRVHPYRHPVIGYEEVFRTITRDNLLDFINLHYVPDNMITVVVGDIDPDEVESFLREAYASFNRRARPPVVLPAEPRQLSARVARATGPYQVSRMHWAYHSVPLGHPDVPALDILANILGQGRSSRLYRRFRDDLHLVHSISAWSHNPQYGGLFGIHAAFDPHHEDELVARLIDEVASWHDTDFTDEEIEKARRNQLVQELASLQTMSGRASSFGSGEYYTGNPRFGETYLDQLAQVTADDLRRVVRTYLRDSNRTLALLTPPVPVHQATEVAASTVDIQRLELDQGIPLIVREDHRLPFVHIAAVLDGGLLSETEEQAGITQLMADLLTRGTRHRTAAEIADQIEMRGASLSAFSGRNTFGLLGTSLSEDAPFLIDLLIECLRDSDFPDAELDRQRAAQLAAIRQQTEQPMTVAQEVLRSTLFPGHPYQWTTVGREAAVQSISREDLFAYTREHMRAGNLSLAVFGNITPDEARDLVSTALREFPSGDRTRPEIASPAPELPEIIVQDDPSEQGIVLVGYPGIDIHDPRNDALSLLQRISSGLSSDLAIDVRDQRGLAYFVGAMSLVGMDPGFYSFYAGTTAEAMDEVAERIDVEVNRLRTEGPREEELQRAVEQSVAEHHMGLQNNLTLAQQCAMFELYGLGYRYVLDLEERLSGLTTEDLRRTANELLEPERQVQVHLKPVGRRAAP